MTPHFFEDPAEVRRWFARHHARAAELVVGFWKVGSGEGGARYRQVLDEALCFGWIDGIAHRLDGERYTVRFTPRRPRSTWSLVNIKRARQLIAEGRMRPAGMRAFEARDEKRSRLYSHEATQSTPLGEAEEGALKANRKAWAYFQAQRPSYRKTASYWVMTAKKEETRQRRLQALIDCSARGEWLPWYRWTADRSPKVPRAGAMSGRVRRRAVKPAE